MLPFLRLNFYSRSFPIFHFFISPFPHFPKSFHFFLPAIIASISDAISSIDLAVTFTGVHSG